MLLDVSKEPDVFSKVRNEYVAGITITQRQCIIIQ